MRSYWSRRTSGARHRIAAVTAVAAAALALAACGSSGAATSAGSGSGGSGTPITFALDFTYDGLHAPFFDAQQKGYYKQAGLNVTFRPGTGSSDAINKVSSGVAQAGVASATNVLTAATSGSSFPITVTGMLLPHSPIAIETLKNSGVTQLNQLYGKTLGQAPATSVGLSKATMLGAGMNPGKVNIVDLNPSVMKQSLLSGKVTAVQAYAQVFADSQSNVHFFYSRNYGIDPYGSTVIFSNSFIKAHPAAVKAFMTATMKGLRDAIADPQAAGEAVASASGTSPAYYADEVKLLNPFWGKPAAGTAGFGQMTAAGWTSTEQVNLKYLGQKAPLPAAALSKLWTNDYLGS